MIISLVEYVLFSNNPFYMAYIQEHGFFKAFLKLNPVYHFK